MELQAKILVDVRRLTTRTTGHAVQAVCAAGAPQFPRCQGFATADATSAQRGWSVQRPVERLGQELQLLGDALGFLRPQPEPALDLRVLVPPHPTAWQGGEPAPKPFCENFRPASRRGRMGVLGPARQRKDLRMLLHWRRVVMSGAFIFFLLRQHFITEKKKPAK